MIRECAQCHAEFVAAVHNQIRCSHRCTRQAAKSRERTKQRGCEIPGSRHCDHCGTAFKPGSIRARYCSRKCRARAKDRMRANRWKIKRLTIFDRDGWICQICGEPVDPLLSFPHPRCATVDHIFPAVRGGGDDLGNLQLAHMDCNSSKGDSVT